MGCPLSFLLTALVLPASADEVVVYPPTGSTPYLSVEESLKTFHLPEGYSLEPVLTEPQIKEPVTCAFDGNGRLYVVEMRTYMQDANATGEKDRKSRVSLHEDTDGDGTYDKHTVFADHLLLPRMVLPLHDSVLIGETNTLDIYRYQDTDGDGVSDQKTLWYQGGRRGGNMEHQPSGLIWSMDNWIYTTYNNYRLRHNPDGLAHKEPTASNGGQWGLTQDDHGKPWFVNAGGERGPLNYQQPIVYGAFNISHQQPADFREVYPLVGIPDVQGGKSRFRPDNKTLNHFTATCGQGIFRGDRLPEELRGDLLFSEPVGRLIRRSKVEVRDGVTYLKNAHPGSEFIRSTDPNFRAMHMQTGPDGCLYIVDMYRGIIQQGNWTKKGSYLRSVIDDHGFAKNIQRGRIYRLVHKDFKPGPQPKLLDATSAELVKHLAHPNGWWRDNAQKLLILRGDTSVTPALEKMTSTHDFDLARMHALWALEGLGTLTADFVRKTFKDEHASVRRAAIRVSETLIKAGDTSLQKDLLALAGDSDPEVATQVLLTAKLLNFPDFLILASETPQRTKSAGVEAFAEQLISGSKGSPPKLNAGQLAQYKSGQNIYKSLCFSCHGADGKGTPIPGTKNLLAPSFAGSKIINGHPELGTKVVLHGLSGPIDGKTYAGDMIAMASNGDAFIADVLSYIRNSFGNEGGFISENDVKNIREENSDRKTPWTMETLMASVPQMISNRKDWKLTASDGDNDLKNALDGKLNTRWSTGRSMRPGMWIQIELPEETSVAGLILDAAKSKNDYPRGCEVEFSDNGEEWSQPVKVNERRSPRLSIDFKPRETKFIRITQRGKHKLFWSIHDLQVLKAP
ncbi:MAG: discoidin domain-containing protein [Akkermansiaceae bacterium]